MKKSYSNNFSSLQCVPSKVLDGVYEITNIWTDPLNRKAGYATSLLKQACRDADIQHKVLMVQPKEYGNSNGLRDLASWYKKFDFVKIQANPILMARAAQKHTPNKTKVSESIGV